jgi:hypothetical protein
MPIRGSLRKHSIVVASFEKNSYAPFKIGIRKNILLLGKESFESQFLKRRK